MASPITSKDLFWAKVAETPTTYSPDAPIVIEGKIVTEKASSLQNEMFSSCSLIDAFVAKLFSSPFKEVLDLGAGIGANTLPLAKSGSHVTAIDASRELLTTFSTNSVGMGCGKNIRLRRGDITTMDSYGGPFNLVVAVDIFPYIPPATLRSTMEKIHQCLEERGILIGTILTSDLSPVMREFMGKLGAHFYENSSQFVIDLLEHSGFKPLELEARSEGGFRFKAEKRHL